MRLFYLSLLWWLAEASERIRTRREEKRAQAELDALAAASKPIIGRRAA